VAGGRAFRAGGTLAHYIGVLRFVRICGRLVPRRTIDATVEQQSRSKGVTKLNEEEGPTWPNALIETGLLHGLGLLAASPGACLR
jgi:hypothetical protein